MVRMTVVSSSLVVVLVVVFLELMGVVVLGERMQVRVCEVKEIEGWQLRVSTGCRRFQVATLRVEGG